MNPTDRNTYRPIADLLTALVDRGCELHVDNGDGEQRGPYTVAQALDEIYAVEQAYVWAKGLGWFFIIPYGVDYADAITDYAAERGHSNDELDAIVEPIYTRYEEYL